MQRFLFFYQNKIILLLETNHSNWPVRLQSRLLIFFLIKYLQIYNDF